MRFAITTLIPAFLLAIPCTAQEPPLYPDYWFSYNTVELNRPLAADSAVYEVNQSAFPCSDGSILHFYNVAEIGVVYQIYDPYGCKRFPTPPQPAPEICDEYSGSPKVASDTNEGFYVMWTNSAGVNLGAFAQHLDSLGMRLWGDTGIQILDEWNPIASGDDYAVSPDGVGGFLMTYLDGLNNDIIVHRIDCTGQKLWGEHGVTVCNHPSSQDMPRVTHDGNGGAYVVWRDYRPPDVWPDSRGYVQKVDSDGNIQWADNGVCLYNNPPWFFHTISDKAGGFILHTGSGDENFAYRVDPNGHMLWELEYVSWGWWAQIAD
jgi:hypothetical protein